MVTEAIRLLLDEDLTTRKEIQLVTGRGASTVHRWVKGESEPQFTDVRLLVRKLSNPEARRRLIGVLSGDLPLQITWLDDEEIPLNIVTNEDRLKAGEHGMDISLLALECITELLTEEQEAMRKKKLTSEAAARIVRLCDDAIRHLTTTKNLAMALVTTAPKKARQPELSED